MARSSPPGSDGLRASKPDIVVLDYGSGNLRSAVRALERAGASVQLTADPATAEHADGLVVPGVGAFAACMTGLRSVHGPRTIGRRLAGGRPVLGICVGMQVLFEHGVEHGVETEGCHEWPGVVERLRAPVVPHMGWNTVEVPEGSGLFAGIEDQRFYFVHSYAARSWDLVTDGHTRAPLGPGDQRPHDRSARHVGRARRGPVRRGGGERPADGDPVPPGEVRRRRSRPAPQLGGRPVSGARARGGPQHEGDREVAGELRAHEVAL
jgi:glutamine amidotransferase